MRYRIGLLALLAVASWLLPYGLDSYSIHVVNVIIIFAVLAFFFVQRQPRQLAMSYEKLGHVENDLAMVKPRLTVVDAKGNPFVITAKKAVQDAKNPKRATIETIEADHNTRQG